MLLLTTTSLFAAFILSASAAKLESFNVDPTSITTSGISSGGYFTVQMHVAFSSVIKGVGVVAGGPFFCANGNVFVATQACMTQPSRINLDSLVATTNEWAASNYIDDTSNLNNVPVYIFQGAGDTKVLPGVGERLIEYYRRFGANVTASTTLDAGHGFPTLNYGNPCKTSDPPYINNCNFDVAGEIFQKLYGPLKRKVVKAGGFFVAFDQTEFYEQNGRNYGLADEGWMYVPEACYMMPRKTVCRLHVAFHGCHQNFASISEKFFKYAGYNEWAESNNIIVIYPQTGKGATNNCWDWWGDQGDSSSYATKRGHQTSVIKRIIDRAADRINGEPVAGKCSTSNNYGHLVDGRAYEKDGRVYAKGSDADLGALESINFVSLRHVSPEYYILVPNCRDV